MNDYFDDSSSPYSSDSGSREASQASEGSTDSGSYDSASSGSYGSGSSGSSGSGSYGSGPSGSGSYGSGPSGSGSYGSGSSGSGSYGSGPSGSGSYGSGPSGSYGSNNTSSPQAPVHDNPAARERMATAALVLGIASVVTFQIFFIALPMSLSAVILALLSRGKGRMIRRAGTGLIAGAAAAVLSLSITGYAVYTVYTDPEMRRQFEVLYQYYTGQSFFGDDASSSDSLQQAPLTPEEDTQALIQDILSGNYRKHAQNKDASSDEGQSSSGLNGAAAQNADNSGAAGEADNSGRAGSQGSADSSDQHSDTTGTDRPAIPNNGGSFI